MRLRSLRFWSHLLSSFVALSMTPSSGELASRVSLIVRHANHGQALAKLGLRRARGSAGLLEK